MACSMKGRLVICLSKLPAVERLTKAASPRVREKTSAASMTARAFTSVPSFSGLTARATTARGAKRSVAAGCAY